MEVPVDHPLALQVYDALLRQHLAVVQPFERIVPDYQSCSNQIRELRVRNTQLDKEAGELRLQNEELQHELQSARQGVRRSEEYEALRTRHEAGQAELTAALREKAGLAESSVQALRQLQVVREINERQAAELEEMRAELARLRDVLRASRAEADHFREAQAAGAAELQSRLAEATGAVDRAAALETENAELARRLVELKSAEIERMNTMNREREDLLAAAKREASGILASARQRMLQAKRPSEGAEILEASMRSLNMAAAAQTPLPVAAVRSVRAHEGGCFGLAFTRVGDRMASCGADKTVKLWEPGSGAHTGTLHGAHEGLNGVVFTSDGKLVLGADSKAAVRVWEPATGRLRLSLTGHAGKVMAVDASATDPGTVVSCAADRTIKVWGLERGFCLRTIMCHSTCHSLALTLDGSTIASGHFDGALRFWDLRSARLAYEMAGLHSQVSSVAVGMTTGLVLTLGKDNQLRLVEPRTFMIRRTLTAPGFAAAGAWSTACLSPNEDNAAAGGADGAVYLWSTGSGALAARLEEPRRRHVLVGCAWSPAGLPLASCDKSGDVTFWAAV